MTHLSYFSMFCFGGLTPCNALLTSFLMRLASPLFTSFLDSGKLVTACKALKLLQAGFNVLLNLRLHSLIVLDQQV